MNIATATYCPEDDKLRLYIGRVSREEYLELRKQGWTSTPKQDCDFVAVWTPSREDTALKYSDGIIEDEDQSPADRAADRAERFQGYLDKRTNEALQLADKYDNQPMLHGHQSAALAERSAARHDAIATRAVNRWDKAEYWHARTAGVISNALHKASPGVRMGRIKVLEAEIRKAEASKKEYATTYSLWEKVATIDDPKQAYELAYALSGASGMTYYHPKATGSAYARSNKVSMYRLLTDSEDPLTGREAAALWLLNHEKPSGEDGRYLRHLKLRLEYENQMLEAQGGRLATVDIEPGGFIGDKQVMSVNKSPATGRVTSVYVKIPKTTEYAFRVSSPAGLDYSLLFIKTERLKPDAYRPPTEEERVQFSKLKLESKKIKAKISTKIPLINPTNEDAERLQKIWNERYTTRTPREVKYVSQKTYSLNSKGTYAHYETVEVVQGGAPKSNGYNVVNFPTVMKVRSYIGSVVVITDKPQKPVPIEVFEDPIPSTIEKVKERWGVLMSALHRRFSSEMTEEEREVFKLACMCKIAYSMSATQFALTEDGIKIGKELRGGEQ